MYKFVTTIVKEIAIFKCGYFLSAQQINIQLLRKEYFEYTNVHNEMIAKHPKFVNSYYQAEYNNFSQQLKDDIEHFSNKQRIIRDRFINNARVYSVNYPNEKIAKNICLIEYDEFPYRLHQNVKSLFDDIN